MSSYSLVKYPWHIGHDYELAKIPHSFFFLKNTYRNWVGSQRPLPSSITWVSDLREVKADAMILHLDQWSYHEPAKRMLFLSAKRHFKGPKIVIIHGCNMLDGCTSEQMQTLTDGCHVVVNSSTALNLWGLPDSRFILHGMSADEWPASNYKTAGVLMSQPTSLRHAATRNDAGVRLAEKRIELTWFGRDVRCDSFDAYRNVLSSSSIYFNPSHASCNPRARAEAMLCGLVNVTTASHGEHEYIENGENGYCSNNVKELVDYIEHLLENPDEIARVGAKGRDTARELFSIKRFSSEWNALLDEVISHA